MMESLMEKMPKTRNAVIDLVFSRGLDAIFEDYTREEKPKGPKQAESLLYAMKLAFGTDSCLEFRDLILRGKKRLLSRKYA